MFASVIHFAPPRRAAAHRAQPHERRVAWALVCSGAFHVLMAASVGAWIAWRPAPPPKTDVAPVLLHAKLDDFRPTPAALELIPLPQIVTEPVPILTPAPTLPVTPVNDSARRPSPAARPNITTADPNGSIVMGQLEDAGLLGRIVAAKLGQRYTAIPDREPRLIGSLIVPYPPEARQARVSARIAAVLDINAQGAITNISLVPDHRWFGPAVLEVLKDARFTPAEIASHPVPYWAIVEFVFAIPPGPAS